MWTNILSYSNVNYTAGVSYIWICDCFQQNVVCLDYFAVTPLCSLMFRHRYPTPLPFVFSKISITSVFSTANTHIPGYFSDNILSLEINIKITQKILHTYMLCRLFHLVFCVEYALVFFLPPPTPGEIYRCEKGDVHEKMGFHRVLSCVDVLVDITVVAVKRLIREKLYFLTVNCQPCELYLSCNRFAHPS